MFTELQTNRLILRPLRTNDLVFYHKFVSDPENTTFMYYLPYKSLEETEKYLTKITEEWTKSTPSFYEFAILLQHKLIGSICLYLNDTKTEGELGYVLDKDFWGRGYGTEAAVSILKYGISVLGLKKIIGQCDKRNAASAHVLQKIGMKLLPESGWRTYPKSGETAEELTFIYTSTPLSK